MEIFRAGQILWSAPVAESAARDQSSPITRLRKPLTFANVVACLALFVALGGVSYAAIKLPRNSVGAGQLKTGAVTAAKIKKGAVTGAKLDLATLGTVPSAASASHAATADSAASAQTLGGESAAQLAAGSQLRCPAGTRLEAGICFETATRPAATLVSAIFVCAKAARWLPSIEQVISFQVSNYTTPQPQEWTSAIYAEGGGATHAMAASGSEHEQSFGPVNPSTPLPYRCVVGPEN